MNSFQLSVAYSTPTQCGRRYLLKQTTVHVYRLPARCSGDVTHG